MPANVERTHRFEPLRVEGTLPPALRGRLFRAGPGLFERAGVTLSHPFVADGAIIGVEFSGDGRARGAVRYVESEGFRRDQAAGRFVTGAHAPWWRRALDLVRGKNKNTGNTSLLCWQHRLFALMEAGLPVEMNPDGLETIGATDLGVVKSAFSAHPRRHPTRASWFNFGVRFGPRTRLDLYELPDDGAPRSLGQVDAPWAAMIHDCALTEHHMVFVVGPGVLQLGAALLGRDMTSMFAWEPARGARIVVVPLDRARPPFTLEIDPCWVWHVVNGFERDGEIFVDVIQYPDLDTLKVIADSAVETAPPQYIRWIIDPRTKTARPRQLWDVPCEFPTVPARTAGRAHDLAFLLLLRRLEDGARRHGVGIFDPAAGGARELEFPEGCRLSEPLYIEAANGDANGELEGHLITLVRDRNDGPSHFAVLSAARLEDGPIARVWFDQALPETFHGRWVPS